MLLIEWFSKDCCINTEVLPGWYWFDDADDSLVGGPYETEEEAIEAAQNKTGWTYPFLKLH